MGNELQTITTILKSGKWQLVAAGIVFLLVWALKSFPWLNDKVLTTPRRKHAAVAILAIAPAVSMFACGSPLVDAIVAGLIMFFSAIGINEMRAHPGRTGITVFASLDTFKKIRSTAEKLSASAKDAADEPAATAEEQSEPAVETKAADSTSGVTVHSVDDETTPVEGKAGQETTEPGSEKVP